jgi:hypothetical protein
METVSFIEIALWGLPIVPEFPEAALITALFVAARTDIGKRRNEMTNELAQPTSVDHEDVAARSCNTFGDSQDRNSTVQYFRLNTVRTVIVTERPQCPL